MTSSRRSYRVSVAGHLSPMLCSTFSDFETTFVPASTVFRVELPSEGRADDIAGMLKDKGLVMLSIRRIDEDAAESESEPETPPED